jgi:hypothetical protein
MCGKLTNWEYLQHRLSEIKVRYIGASTTECSCFIGVGAIESSKQENVTDWNCRLITWAVAQAEMSSLEERGRGGWHWYFAHVPSCPLPLFLWASFLGYFRWEGPVNSLWGAEVEKAFSPGQVATQKCLALGRKPWPLLWWEKCLSC